MKINIILITFICWLVCFISCKLNEKDGNIKINLYVGDDNYTKILRNEFLRNDRYLVTIMFTNKNC